MAARGLSRAGSWTFIDKLGAGGGGDVYLGKRIGLRGQEEKAAIKVVRYTQKDAAKAQFLIHEHELLSQLNSPYIAKTFDSGQEMVGAQQYVWIAVEQIKGDDLFEEVRKDGPLSKIEWLDLAHDLFSALDTAHSKGIIHKDIKPQNIIRNSRRAILLDFGFGSYINRKDAGDVASISLGWTAPEQMDYTVNPESYQAGVDLFQAAAVLVFAATARGPWELTPDLMSNWRLGPKERALANKRYADGVLRGTAPSFHGMDPELVAIVKPMLASEARSRGTAKAALSKVTQMMPMGAGRKTSEPAPFVDVAEKPQVEKPAAKPKQPASEVVSAKEGQPKPKPKTVNGAAPKPTAVTTPEKNFRQALFLATWFGWLGADRFYLEKFGTGILKFVTLGGYGIWWWRDAMEIARGDARDGINRALAETPTDRRKAVSSLRLKLVVAIAALFLIGVSGQASNQPDPTPGVYMPDFVGTNLYEAEKLLNKPQMVSVDVSGLQRGIETHLKTQWKICAQEPSAGQILQGDYVGFDVVLMGEDCP